MITEHISHISLHQLPEAVAALLKGDERLHDFVSYFPSEEGIAAKINEASMPVERRALTAERLRLQYGELMNDHIASQLERFKDENTFTVTTGHQLNIFTGPAFFFYKILHTIKLSQYLNQRFPEKHFIPVYWMATEDHDLAEINHTHLFRDTLTWNREEEGAVGRMSTEGLMDLALQFKLAMRWEDDDEHWRLFKQYANAENLAAATRGLVNALFGKDGLIIIDGDDSELKRAFLPLMKLDALEGIGERAVSAQSDKLEKLGFNTQVHPRSVNLFYLHDKQRIRLDREGDYYVGIDSSIKLSKSELIDEMEQHPERFSPNVILRPVYQELILPNIAYIGGPGEMSYWLQLKGVFDAMDVSFPVLIPRNGVLVMNHSALAKKEKLGLATKSLFRERVEDIVREWVDGNATEDFDLSEAKQAISRIFDKVKEQSIQVDPTLGKKVEGSLQRQIKELEGLEKAMEKAWKRGQETAVSQLESLHATVFPEGVFQERRMNFFGLAFGFEDLAHTILEKMNPLDPGILFIGEEKRAQ